jgi:hypothetical protein
MQGFFVDTKRKAVVGPPITHSDALKGRALDDKPNRPPFYVNLLEVAAIRRKDRICGCFTCRMGSIAPTLSFLL